jgi:hypothetical protein
VQRRPLSLFIEWWIRLEKAYKRLLCNAISLF